MGENDPIALDAKIGTTTDVEEDSSCCAKGSLPSFPSDGLFLPLYETVISTVVGDNKP
jgi:hypothetical protein